MSEIFTNIPEIRYEGPDSKNAFAFKYYDPEKVVLGKKMSEHLPFAMAWWHNLCANGTDMFGRGTADKRFGADKEGTMEHAKAKVDAGINFDSKNRRPSNTYEDMFHAFILGMDSFAFGLLKAAALIEDGRIEGFVEKKYESFNTELGQKIRKGETTLSELAERASELKNVKTPISGNQEYLEGVFNNILLSGF